MPFSSLHLLFLSLLIMGTMTALSATSWFIAWVGLELNLMSFIPLITDKHNQFPSEAALKYFLIQALGSSMVIFAGPLSLHFPVFQATILIALLMKLGAAPFHFWFPAIMEGLNWTQSILLLTIQKVAPMFLISHLISNWTAASLVLLAALASALVGSVGGLNQLSLRKILAFSSIAHMGWMLAAISLQDSLWILYFIFYSGISTSIALLFKSQQSFYFPQLLTKSDSQPSLNIMNSFSLLSLGGLPPFSGFLPKWILIESLINTKMYFPLLILILSALITLYYYLRLSSLALLLLSTKKKITFHHNKPTTLTPLLISSNLICLFIPSIFLLF
uniref:NADH-ubiquinone oxidoreductase chain 2 n=1 Tax=Linuparus trigonus TaxID=198218 RepID=A0A7D3Q8A9_9EUCA|nr:NADH dehydrogenase subunit 2 [Linuparus trigonus]QKE42646.1 NADH dehydrogenase subunit 2 [Linuparus trigonus]